MKKDRFGLLIVLMFLALSIFLLGCTGETGSVKEKDKSVTTASQGFTPYKVCPDGAKVSVEDKCPKGTETATTLVPQTTNKGTPSEAPSQTPTNTPMQTSEVAGMIIGNKDIETRNFQFHFKRVATRDFGTFQLARPKGKFVIFYLTVKNVSKEKQEIYPSDFILIDANANKYEGEDVGCGETLWVKINPQFSTEFCFNFDVPKETTFFTLNYKDEKMFDIELASGSVKEKDKSVTTASPTPTPYKVCPNGTKIAVDEKCPSEEETAATPVPTTTPTPETTPPANVENVENGKIGTTYEINYLNAKYEVTLKEAEFAESQSEFFDKYYLMAFFEIKNVGDESEYFSPDIYFVDKSQEKYDRTIAIDVGDKYSKTMDFLKKLSPNTKMSGWVAIEVPKGTSSGNLFYEYSNPLLNKKPKYIKYTITG